MLCSPRAIQLTCLIDLEAALREGEGVVAVGPTKSREPRGFTRFAASEEGVHRQIKTDRHVLEHLRVDGTQRRAFLLQKRIGGLLLVARQASASLLIGVFPFLLLMVRRPP